MVMRMTNSNFDKSFELMVPFLVCLRREWPTKFAEFMICQSPQDVELCYRNGCPREMVPFMHDLQNTEFYGFVPFDSGSISYEDQPIRVFCDHAYVFGWDNFHEFITDPRFLPSSAANSNPQIEFWQK